MSDILDRNKILGQNSYLYDVKILENSASTQKDAKADGQDNCLYLAENQTKAYGRFGRAYFARQGSGIYMSLLLKWPVSADKMPNFTILAGAAIVSAIEKRTDKKPQIKWVNDIYLDGKKMAGILAEAAVNADNMEVIIGIGLNFSIQEFPDELADKATSLFTETETEPIITRNELIADIWNEFYSLMNADYFSIYKSHSFILGRRISFDENQLAYEGKAIDLTPEGELIVQLANGQKKNISSGEISLKKWTD